MCVCVVVLVSSLKETLFLMLICCEISRFGLQPAMVLLQAAFVASGSRGSEQLPEQNRSPLLSLSFSKHE